MRAFNIDLVKQYIKLPSEFELDVESFNRAKLFINEYVILPIIGQALYNKLASTFIAPIIERQALVQSMLHIVQPALIALLGVA